jgi:hypothetical protein
MNLREQICSGLFWSNLAKPPKRNIEAIWCDYHTGGIDRILYDVDRLLGAAGRRGVFRQEWVDRMRYCGTSSGGNPAWVSSTSSSSARSASCRSSIRSLVRRLEYAHNHAFRPTTQSLKRVPWSA